MLFQQSTAPTGWTKQTTHNDKALRVVSGTASSGGSVAFSSAFSSITPTGSVSTSVTGTVANHTLSVDQIPAHSHETTFFAIDNGSGGGGPVHARLCANGTSRQSVRHLNSVGGGQGHNHGFSGSATSTFTGSAINLDVQYVDVIIAAKD